jgi:predicted PurR-regulated permease PerM
MDPQGDTGIWDRRVVRELSALLCVVVLVYVAYRIRATLAPIGLAFLLSYAVEPAVRYLRDHYRVPRGASAAISLVIFIAGVAAFWVWAGPKFAEQTNALFDKLPDYAEVLRDHLGIEAGNVDEFIESLKDRESGDVQRAVQLSNLFVAGAQRMFGFVGTIAAGTLYAVIGVFLVIVFFFLFVTYRGWGKHLEWLAPASRRESIRKVLGYMDRALGAYVRGQLLVALFTFTGFSVGFFLVDVPYWFVVALIGGLASLIPYGQVLGPVVAITLKLLESQVGETAFSWWGVLLAPLVVYGITQSLESWVITPIVQGEINKLHPAVIITVLILGGSIAGVAGLILAIPVAATVRASLQEFVLDKNQNDADRASAGNG